MQSPIRLALRQEGHMLNAYVADPGTMDGAMLIGSIALRLCQDNPRLRDDFQEIMTQAMLGILRNILGVDTPIGVRVQEAPEHERGGNA